MTTLPKESATMKQEESYAVYDGAYERIYGIGPSPAIAIEDALYDCADIDTRVYTWTRNHVVQIHPAVAEELEDNFLRFGGDLACWPKRLLCRNRVLTIDEGV